MISPTLLVRSTALVLGLAIATAALASSDVASDRGAAAARSAAAAAHQEPAQPAPASQQGDCACHAKR